MSFNQTILSQDDPADYIYECLSFTHGKDLYDYIYEMYTQVSIDYRLHPDDDFEQIIDTMLIQMCGDWK